MTFAKFLRERLGQEVAVGEWMEVTQQRIDRFAEATDDRQWIHVDPARAAVESPFKTTIAHGFLTLSLMSALARRALTFGGVALAINYGLNRVRFVSPLPAGARVRGRFSPLAVEDAAGGSLQVTWGVTLEREHGDKPCCVAEWLVRYYERDHGRRVQGGRTDEGERAVKEKGRTKRKVRRINRGRS